MITWSPQCRRGEFAPRSAGLRLRLSPTLEPQCRRGEFAPRSPFPISVGILYGAGRNVGGANSPLGALQSNSVFVGSDGRNVGGANSPLGVKGAYVASCTGGLRRNVGGANSPLGAVLSVSVRPTRRMPQCRRGEFAPRRRDTRSSSEATPRPQCRRGEFAPRSIGGGAGGPQGPRPQCRRGEFAPRSS